MQLRQRKGWENWACSAWKREDFRAFQYLKGACRKDGERLLTRTRGHWTRENGFKLPEGSIRWDIRKTFFPVWVLRPWHWVPREAVAALSLAVS